MAYPYETRRSVIDAYRAGWSIQRIMREFGVTHGTIHNWLADVGERKRRSDLYETNAQAVRRRRRSGDSVWFPRPHDWFPDKPA